MDKNSLQDEISKLEINGPLESRSKLYQELNKIYPDIKFMAIFGRRIQQWNLNVKTPKPDQVADSAKKTSLKKNPTINFYKTTEGGKYKKTAISLSQGSLKAAIKLKCLDCCCYKAEEIKLCTITECSLHPFRPYK